MDVSAPDLVAHPPRRAHRLAGLVVLVTLAVVLAGCGGDDDSPSADPTTPPSDSPSTDPTGPPSDSPSTDPTTSPTDSPVVIEVTIADGKVTPAGEQVEAEVGQQIQLRVDSDAPDELHVHSSPEHEFEILAKDGQLFSFSVDQPGQVEIETHETETVIAELVVS